MSEVVSVIQPFVLSQQVYVFEGQEIVRQFSTTLADMPQELIAFCHGNNIFDVSLRGDAQFVAKIKRDIESKEMAQYSVNQIRVNAV